MAFTMGRGVCLVWSGLAAAACGSADDLEALAAQPGLSDFPEPVVIGPARAAPREPAVGGLAAPAGEVASEGEASDPAAPEPGACRAPAGVSGRPRTLDEAIVLMNSLPRPTTLPCFLEALERPLSLYMTRSALSLQPSTGARSPRTFIVSEPLVMSIVFDGVADATLELGYRTTPSRSIKTEIVFPLEAAVTYDNFFDEVRRGDATVCGGCHIAEVRTAMAGFPGDVFESDIIAPIEVYDVDVPAVRAEAAACDAAVEPERCALLESLFGHGDVSAAPAGIMF